MDVKYQLLTLPSPDSGSIVGLAGTDDGKVIASSSTHNLFVLRDSQWVNIHVPDGITISNFAFSSPNEGIIVGQSLNQKVDENSHEGILILTIVVVLISLIIYSIIRFIRKKRWKFLLILCSIILIAICGVVALIKHPSTKTFEFEEGSHYLENGQSSCPVFYTRDGGNHWKSIAIPTNFHLSSSCLIDSGYLISSYGSESHLDGDLWKLESKQIDKPLLWGACRALRGIKNEDKSIIAFGSNVSVAIIGNPWAKIPGEIIQMPASLDSANFTDLPNHLSVISVAAGSNGIIWAISENKKLYSVQNRNYISEIATPIDGNMKDVEILGQMLLILSNQGDIWSSQVNSNAWKKVPLDGLHRINSILRIKDEIFLGGDKGFISKLLMR